MTAVMLERIISSHGIEDFGSFISEIIKGKRDSTEQKGGRSRFARSVIK
jgi:hypothetical protein